MANVKTFLEGILHDIKQQLGFEKSAERQSSNNSDRRLGFEKSSNVKSNDRTQSPLRHPTEFQAYPGHHTESPRFPYTLFAYGTLPTTERVAIHYLRVRPFMGTGDPAFFGSIPNRQRLLQTIIATTLAPENKHFWSIILSHPPTHVVRLGFVWRLTGEHVDILYLPLNLYQPGHSSESLARECANHLMSLLIREKIIRLLCPPPDRMRGAQIFWLSMIFLKWRWLVCDRYRVDSI